MIYIKLGYQKGLSKKMLVVGDYQSLAAFEFCTETDHFMILLPAAVHSPTSPSKKMLQSLGDSHLKAYDVLLCTPSSSLLVSRHYHKGQHILQILMNSRDTKHSDVCYVLR
jgi:hypothetical protein